MKNVFIDPSLRRAWLVRITGGLLVAVTVGIVAVFSCGLTPEARRPLSLPSPRRALARAIRRPAAGRRPPPGHAGARRAPSTAPRSSSDGVRPEVIAFVDPSVKGALESLDRHAEALSEVAPTGLILGERGAIIDRIDPGVLDVARSHHLPVTPLVQDLDESDGRWRGDRVDRMVADPAARRRFADSVEVACATHGLDGVHLDFEDLAERSWPRVPALVEAVARRLKPRGLTVAIDVPTGLPPARIAALARAADRVVVMAYDLADDQGDPGPIATDGYVDDALGTLDAIPPAKRTAGLGIYGYDWVGSGVADPLSFVDALAAAKEARVDPVWDGEGPRFHFSDDEGAHEVWFLDGATLWNQLQITRRHAVPAVALWRLGGEDPAVWDALAAFDRPALEVAERLRDVAADDRVENLGDGPFLSLALSAESGVRALTVADGRIAGEAWQRLPSPYLVRRAGIVPGRVALTFDDGPDPRFTPAVLDLLRARHVPATFFVVGANAERAPDLVRRAFAEGHQIGNHSFTHPDVDAVDDARLQLELELTSRLIETLIGRRPLLYRPPSLKDVEPRSVEAARAFARAGSLGYLVVDADVDPRDWESGTTAELEARVLGEAQRGGVVLLHDGGGDRSTTVRALPAIIDGLRARGLEIVPLGALVGKSPDQVMPPAVARGRVAQAADQAVFGGASIGLAVAGWCLTVALGLIALRALAVVGLALWAARRRRSATLAIGPVTVLIPAFNERAVIVRTVESVLASDIPVEIVVIDDGSTDGTADAVADRFGRDGRVRIILRPNGGKAAALRTGFAAARTEVVVALDGDTLFQPDTARLLAAPFGDPRVGAVAGNAEVGNLVNGLTKLQALEYLVQQEVERRSWDALRALPVVPGAVGAWRRRAVLAVGGFSSATLAEDADLAMALCRGGWRVIHEPAARAWTEAPETLRALVKQRVRWSFGILQAMWKHRGALCERRAGWFGRVVLPSMIVYQVLLPLLAPAAAVAAMVAALGGHLAPALWASGVLLAVEAGQAALACRFARRGWRLLPWLATARLVYRPLLFAVLMRSLTRVLDGIPLGWNKLARRGTVRL